MDVKRGDIIFVDIDDNKGSEQGGERPAVVIQNDVGNKFSTTTIVCLITSKFDKPKLPTHVYLSKKCGLPKNSIIMAEQIRVVDEVRILDSDKRLHVSDTIMDKINNALRVSINV